MIRSFTQGGFSKKRMSIIHSIFVQNCIGTLVDQALEACLAKGKLILVFLVA